MRIIKRMGEAPAPKFEFDLQSISVIVDQGDGTYLAYLTPQFSIPFSAEDLENYHNEIDHLRKIERFASGINLMMNQNREG